MCVHTCVSTMTTLYMCEYDGVVYYVVGWLVHGVVRICFSWQRAGEMVVVVDWWWWRA